MVAVSLKNATGEGWGEPWERVTPPDTATAYINHPLRGLVAEEWGRQGRSFSEEELLTEVDQRRVGMSDAECEDILRGMMPEILQDEIADVIAYNYRRIRQDIEDLIRDPEEDPIVDSDTPDQWDEYLTNNQ